MGVHHQYGPVRAVKLAEGAFLVANNVDVTGKSDRVGGVVNVQMVAGGHNVAAVCLLLDGIDSHRSGEAGGAEAAASAFGIEIEGRIAGVARYGGDAFPGRVDDLDIAGEIETADLYAGRVRSGGGGDVAGACGRSLDCVNAARGHRFLKPRLALGHRIAGHVWRLDLHAVRSGINGYRGSFEDEMDMIGGGLLNETAFRLHGQGASLVFVGE